MFRKVGDAQSITKVIVAEEVDETGVLTNAEEVAGKLAAARKRVGAEAAGGDGDEAGIPLGETAKAVLGGAAVGGGGKGLAEMLGLKKN